MKKIWLSMLTIVLTVGTVAGAAYALFSDTVTVQGISITTGTADLKINNSNDPYIVPAGLTDLKPGEIRTGYAPFTLNNASTAGIDLALKAQLTGYGTEFDNFKTKVSMRILRSDGLVGSEWKTLNEWTTDMFTLNSTIANGGSTNYYFEVKVDSTAGNTMAGKTLDSVKFEITGEQI
jgi:hypothetical protein